VLGGGNGAITRKSSEHPPLEEEFVAYYLVTSKPTEPGTTAPDTGKSLDDIKAIESIADTSRR
jgi:hypothetical protein